MAMQAKHFDGGKSRVDLIPCDALMSVGEVFAYGAEKYGEHNWENGLPWGKLFGSTLRHLFKWATGEDRDDESGLPHLSHAATDVLMLLAYWVRNRIDLDDRWVPGVDDRHIVYGMGEIPIESEGGTPD